MNGKTDNRRDCSVSPAFYNTSLSQQSDPTRHECKVYALAVILLILRNMKAKNVIFPMIYFVTVFATAPSGVRPPISALTYHRLCHSALLSPGNSKHRSLSFSSFCTFLAGILYPTANMLTRTPYALFALTDVSLKVNQELKGTHSD